MNVIAEVFYSWLWRTGCSEQPSSGGLLREHWFVRNTQKTVGYTDLHAKNEGQAATSPIPKRQYCFHWRPVPNSIPTVRLWTSVKKKWQIFHWLLMSFQNIRRSIRGILPNHLTLLHSTTPQSLSPKQAYCFMGPIVMFPSVADVKSTAPSASIWKIHSIHPIP